jgi:hypothetical protein
LERRNRVAQIKGKFIHLACDFLSSNSETQEAAIEAVKRKAGKSYKDLDPEEFYDTSVLDGVFKAIDGCESEFMAAVRKKVIGQEVYSTIRFTVGIPEHVKTPLDHVKFEAEGFLLNHRGSDVKPRQVLLAEDHHVVMEAPSPGYDCVWIEGVYEGILRMTGHAGKTVKQTKCVKRGDQTCVFDIAW